jgi:hypothetical protein
MSLFVVILYCCLYLLMFMIVTFDRIEIQRQANNERPAVDLGGIFF